VDKAVQDFLRNVANTVIKLEILSYLHDHPFALDNAAGVAGWINRARAEVARDLEELARAGVVACDGEEPEAVYSFSPDISVRETVNQVVEAYRLTREAVYGLVLEQQRQQQELRRQYQRLLVVERGRTETILNSLEEAVVVTDREDRLLLANEPFLSLFCSAGEFRPGSALAETVDDAGVAAAVRDCPENGELEGDFRYGDRFYRIRKNPVTGPDGKLIADQDGKPVGTVTVLRDVTRDREIERMREDFLSMLTHDLKNPLGIIFGSSTLVLDGKIGILNEKQNKMLKNVIKSCGQMETLIDDFLSLSRLEAGQLQLRKDPVVLDSLLEGMLALFEQQIEAAGLTWSFNPGAAGVAVAADRVQLERVIANLVGNSIKYNREGGSIAVATAVEADCVRVEVADTGRGIPAEELPYVFERYRRSASVESMRGSGLGLAVAWSFITAMGGSIQAESEVGKGSRFSVRLPLSPAAGE